MRYDVILAHAPSVYDFHNRDDILFAYLSNSDSVHVSSIFEMPPVGILSLAVDLGFTRQQWFDTEEAFQRVMSRSA